MKKLQKKKMKMHKIFRKLRICINHLYEDLHRSGILLQGMNILFHLWLWFLLMENLVVFKKQLRYLEVLNGKKTMKG
jgi:hypothetical protein